MKRNWILVGAVAAMLATSPSLRAQDNTSGSTSTSTATTPSGTTTSTTDTTTAGTGMTTGTGTDMSGGMSGGMMSGATMDYTMLNNKSFDYVDLMSATARGLKEDEVATVAKIADKTGMPFHEIADAVLRGETFSKLADMYNLKLMDVLDVTDEKTKVASYKMTYESTGWKNVGMMGMGMSGGMSDSSGSMNNMAPGTSGMTDMGTGTTGTGAGAAGTTGTTSTDTTNSTSTTTTTTGQ